jgi:hypothetical protein
LFAGLPQETAFAPTKMELDINLISSGNWD